MLTIRFISGGKVLKKNVKIPSLCPVCGEKLEHINALDTKARMYLVYCKSHTCRYVQDYYLIETCKEVLFSCH